MEVLVVDDDAVQHEVFRKLSWEPIRGFYTGADVLRYLGSLSSSSNSVRRVAFVDVCLPDISGATVRETMRLKYPDVKVILISSDHHSAISEVLPKPITKDVVETALRDATSRKKP
nr:Phosphoacceptor receiver (REC) domain-containing protein [Oceanusvirus sp.]